MNTSDPLTPAQQHDSKTNLTTSNEQTNELNATSNASNIVVYDNKDTKKALEATNNQLCSLLKRTRLTTSILHFANLYGPKKLWSRIAIISLTALLQSFVTLILIQNTGIYNFGLSSITQGLARISFVHLALNQNNITLANDAFNIVFWAAYLVLNIPLFVFSWFKIGKRFTYLTMIYVVVSNLFGLALSFIPNISRVVIFTNANDSFIYKQLLTNRNVNGQPVYPPNSSINNLQGLLASLRFLPVLWQYPDDASKAVGLLFYGLIFAVTTTLFYTIIFVVGGSTGGFDFISQWYANVKQKSLGGVLLYANTALLLLGVLIGSYIPGSLILQKIPETITVNQYAAPGSTMNNVSNFTLRSLARSAPLYFSPNLISTLFAAIIFGALMDSWFPRYRLARVEIYTDKIQEIRNLLINDKNPHSLTIQDVIGGYSLNKRQIIVTISMYIEVPRLIRLIRAVDKTCLLSITTIRGIDGYVFLTESTEA